MQQPRMSVILPNYNSSAFLAHSLSSLVNQTEPFDEILVVDDGSTDKSIPLIESFMQDHPQIKLIKHEKNQGVNAAVNTALAQVTGDYIIFCAADDWFGPHIVAQAKQVAQRHPNVGVICGDAIVKRYDLKKTFHRTLPFPSNTYLDPEAFKAITRKSYVGFNGAGGMFMHTKAILDAGAYFDAARWHSDWLLYFVIAFKQGMYYINDVFIHIDLREASYSQGKNNKDIQNKVMLDTMHIIAKQYPELWEDFKVAGLVPDHALRYLPLFLGDPIAKRFITKRLLWKLIINNPLVVRIGRLFPYRFILKTRQFLRA